MDHDRLPVLLHFSQPGRYRRIDRGLGMIEDEDCEERPCGARLDASQGGIRRTGIRHDRVVSSPGEDFR